MRDCDGKCGSKCEGICFLASQKQEVAYLKRSDHGGHEASASALGRGEACNRSGYMVVHLEQRMVRLGQQAICSTKFHVRRVAVVLILPPLYRAYTRPQRSFQKSLKP